MKPYEVEPYSDFTQAAPRIAYELAIAGIRDRLGTHAPLVIGSDTYVTDGVITSVDPASGGP